MVMNLHRQCHRRQLLKKVAMHIWDEFPMCYRKVFAAVNCCLMQMETPCSGRKNLPTTYATTTAIDLVCLELLMATNDEDEAISFVFPNINDVRKYSQRGSTITGINHVVDALNRKILTMLHGEEYSLFSVTRLCSNDIRMQNLMSTEFLNSLR